MLRSGKTIIKKKWKNKKWHESSYECQSEEKGQSKAGKQLEKNEKKKVGHLFSNCPISLILPCY